MPDATEKPLAYIKLAAAKCRKYSHIMLIAYQGKIATRISWFKYHFAGNAVGIRNIILSRYYLIIAIGREMQFGVGASCIVNGWLEIPNVIDNEASNNGI